MRDLTAEDPLHQHPVSSGGTGPQSYPAYARCRAGHPAPPNQNRGLEGKLFEARKNEASKQVTSASRHRNIVERPIAVHRAREAPPPYAGPS